ncbi:hypothetical protein JCM6882_006253 [Rhodosporidiobolus microsporus]
MDPVPPSSSLSRPLPTSSSLPPRPHPPPHLPSQQQGQIYSTRPRPPPARQGAPASQRNFAQSSAGGATSHLGFGATAGSGGGSGPPPALGAPAPQPSLGVVAAQRGPSPRGLGRGTNRAAGGGGGGEGQVEDGPAGGGRNARRDVGVLSEAQRNKKAHWGDSYVPAEETIRNDYSSEYVQTGARPQNHLRNTAVETRFAEYPKLGQLLGHKHALLSSPHHSIPPTYFNLSSLAPLPPNPISSSSTPAPTSGISSLTPPSDMQRALTTLHPSRFDSILLTPPAHTSFEELAALDLGREAATPGFVWLWVGSGQTGAGAGEGKEGAGKNVGGGVGLEKGRELLSLWGYRRCEDIVWLKTNKRDPEGDLTRDPSPLFTSTIEHCLMGIRGTVRRSTDSNIVHCNVDTDVLVWEGDEEDPDLKPPELQSLIENFCLGTRRLHLYGSPHALRRGWLTVSAPAAPSSSSTSLSTTALSPSTTKTTSEPLYSPTSTVHPVEKEGSEEEQRERWGVEGPREWDKKEWDSRWRRPGVGAGMARSVSGEVLAGASGSRRGSGAEGEGEVVRVESLLPYVEELDALRPKSPPQRNGVPSSGGLGRGRGAGLGVTRSGLVAQGQGGGSGQQASQSSSGTSTPLSGPGLGVGMGRGRGRGNGMLAVPGGHGGAVLPPPPPPPMGMPYPPPAPAGSAPPFPGYPYQQQHFPPPQAPSQHLQHLQQQQAAYGGGTPLQPHPMHPHQPQQQQHSPFSSYAATPQPFSPGGYPSPSPHFQPQQLHPHYNPLHPASPCAPPAPPPSAPPAFGNYPSHNFNHHANANPNPASPYASANASVYHTHSPHSFSPSPAFAPAALPPGVAVHPDFTPPPPNVDQISALLSSTHPFPSFPSSASASGAGSVASSFSPSPGLSPVMNAHYLPRMPSNASLALSSAGGGDGELVYPISSRRTSVTSAASGGVGGLGGSGMQQQ